MSHLMVSGATLRVVPVAVVRHRRRLRQSGATLRVAPLAVVRTNCPLLPPPLEPPPPEAPAPEVAPSKAEVVKKQLVEAPARLELEAYRALEDEFIAVAKPEDLREEDREIYENVRDKGLGVCARCRWLSGCQDCDEVKAWSFVCRTTLWNTAHEAVRPKAKPKGRPKNAADA